MPRQVMKLPQKSAFLTVRSSDLWKHILSACQVTEEALQALSDGVCCTGSCETIPGATNPSKSITCHKGVTGCHKGVMPSFFWAGWISGVAPFSANVTAVKWAASVGEHLALVATADRKLRATAETVRYPELTRVEYSPNCMGKNSRRFCFLIPRTAVS